MSASTLSRRGNLALIHTLLISLAFLAISAVSTSSTYLPTRRDAFTDVRGTAGDKSLASVGARPAGAYARPIPITLTSQIFTWYSKTPNNEADAESAFIIIHGVARNAGTYWTILNNAWAKARDASVGSARPNSIRVAPLFFSTLEDEGAYNATQLGWGDSNAWTAGEASTYPPGSGVSSFTVLDTLLRRFSDKSAYPKMKYITFVAHGGGAQMLQRYAVLGAPNPAPSRLSVRYVVGDPSSELYFTKDRPVGVDRKSCPAWNDYRYGLQKATTNYASLSPKRAPGLFKSYAAKEVRYVVGLADESTTNGDQTCMAHAVGGNHRRNRSLAYWKYIHLLSGTTSPDHLKNFPGIFPALDPKYGATTQTNIPTSSRAVSSRFKGVQVKHSLTVVQGAGHSASKVYGSPEGRNALFADQASSGSGTVPDYSKELDGYTADAAGAKNYSDDDDDDDS
ncbi:hypothetical protein EX895_003416 [Sporisorium graminicola]|uniref:AB hydrolase-1 domain-containing protein n=1 Tax=Sporisorium graminicola TaxID=280036 RepID=A0A4U7KTA6_9BASI|nr:hypothetical protein EX895_003416 [Sporisorium graminicola]TKY87835.1 hypothetical protein EX895_003416 [Sporisorium graminicola]